MPVGGVQHLTTAGVQEPQAGFQVDASRAAREDVAEFSGQADARRIDAEEVVAGVVAGGEDRRSVHRPLEILDFRGAPSGNLVGPGKRIIEDDHAPDRRWGDTAAAKANGNGARMLGGDLEIECEIGAQVGVRPKGDGAVDGEVGQAEPLDDALGVQACVEILAIVRDGQFVGPSACENRAQDGSGGRVDDQDGIPVLRGRSGDRGVQDAMGGIPGEVVGRFADDQRREGREEDPSVRITRSSLDYGVFHGHGCRAFLGDVLG